MLAITHKPLHASIPSNSLNDKIMKYAKIIQVGSSEYKSHFVQIVGYEYHVNIFFIAKTNMTGKYALQRHVASGAAPAHFFLQNTFS